jgi:hypothetical protein
MCSYELPNHYGKFLILDPEKLDMRGGYLGELATAFLSARAADPPPSPAGLLMIAFLRVESASRTPTTAPGE